MLPDRTQDSHPYRSTVTQVVLKSLILVAMETDVLLQIFSSQAVHARAFRLVRSLMLEAIIDPRYLKVGYMFYWLSIYFQWWLRVAVDGHELGFGNTDEEA
jgi:hypothetical protein